jgi:preprotein translocase subunit SecG
MIYFIIGGVAILVAALLVLVVVVQNSKGGGINSAFGSSNLSAMVGSRRATQDIEKLTWYFAAGVLVLCIATSFAAKAGTSDGGSTTSGSKALIGLEDYSGAMAPMPAAPVGGGQQPIEAPAEPN